MPPYDCFFLDFSVKFPSSSKTSGSFHSYYIEIPKMLVRVSSIICFSLFSLGLQLSFKATLASY